MPFISDLHSARRPNDPTLQADNNGPPKRIYITYWTKCSRESPMFEHQD